MKIVDFKGGKRIRVVVPVSLTRSVVDYFHSGLAGAHQGRDAILERISRFYWWTGMKEDVMSVIKSCAVCERYR